MNTAKDIRSDILEILIKMDDIKTLEFIRNELKEIYEESAKQEKKHTPFFMEGVKPIREGISLDQIKSEQDYEPVTYEAFRKIAGRIKWEEPLDELLEAIK